MAKQKTVVITGASRGLGLALVETFQRENWHLIPVVRQESDARILADRFENCCPIVADISQDNSEEIIRAQINSQKRIDVLINNAGVSGRSEGIKETLPSEVLSLINVHCLGVLRVTRAVLPLMSEQGRIANISSRFGSLSKVSKGELDAISCSYSYRIAKAAQNMLTQCLIREFLSEELTIFSIHPGQLLTRMGSSDAQHTAVAAAQKFYQDLYSYAHGKFYSLVEGPIDW